MLAKLPIIWFRHTETLDINVKTKFAVISSGIASIKKAILQFTSSFHCSLFSPALFLSFYSVDQIFNYQNKLLQLKAWL